MKKLLLSIFILFCLQFAPAKAQWVTIPDANFATKLQQLFPSCMNGNQMDTTCSQIVNATSLNINNSNISDLTGIEYFNNLNLFSCSNNQLTSFSGIPNTLDSLISWDNPITNIIELPDSLLYFNSLVSDKNRNNFFNAQKC